MAAASFDDAASFGFEANKKSKDASMSWCLKSSVVVKASNGRFVPKQHLKLYIDIVQKHGDLYPASLDNLMPRVIYSAVSHTLELIHSVSAMKESDLTRTVLNNLLGKLIHARNVGLSVQWLIVKLQEIDRSVDLWDLRRHQLAQATELSGRLQQEERNSDKEYKDAEARLEARLAPSTEEFEKAAKKFVFTRASAAANREVVEELLKLQPSERQLLTLI